MSDKSRIAAVDGLRAVAVSAVIVGHTIGQHAPDAAQRPAQLLNGAAGVTIFFVLSGWLITGILIRERARTGRISRTAFYARRALRILPAFLTFLAVAGVLALAGVLQITLGSWLSAVTFTWNYSPAARSLPLQHLWSLAVEEQFYILWPLLLARLSPRRALQIAIGFILAGPFIRLLTYELVPDVRPRIGLMFHTRADALLIGCALALLPTAAPALHDRLTALVRRRPVEVVAAAAFVLSNALGLVLHGAWTATLGQSVDLLCAAVLLLVAVSDRPSLLRRFLQLRPVVALGLISYSAYLWQQVFIFRFNTTLSGVWPLSWLCILLVATASYHFIEQPFLRRKRRFETAKVPASIA